NKGLQYANTIDDIVEVGEKVHGTIKALAKTVQAALAEANPNEWSLEINLGFKGKAGIPFITEGEANGAVKVVAKWSK
ncbi:MAG: CU044_2847 family protein, partial [Methylomonas sp.]